MKKRFNIGRLGALALALTLITTCLMGGTLAKYTNTVEGTGTATVAKWKVVMKANEKEQESDFTFNLTDAGTNKSNVVEGKVAPGSTGSIPIEIDAAGSEVAATLSYTIDKTGLGDVPIEFYSDATMNNKITWNEGKASAQKEIAVGATSDAAKFTTRIYWKWVSTDDTADTTLGSKDTADVGTIKITLKAEQKIDTASAS